MNLLFIDDDFQIHHIVGSFLDRLGEKNGIKVNLKSILDPVQGLFELCKTAENFDVIALDVRMPQLRGDDIYDLIKESKPHLLDKILFVTGCCEELHVSFPRQKLRVLNKPFRYEQFAEALVSVNG